MSADGWLIYLADDAGRWWPQWNCAADVRYNAIRRYTLLYCGADPTEYQRRRRAGVVKCIKVRALSMTKDFRSGTTFLPKAQSRKPKSKPRTP